MQTKLVMVTVYCDGGKKFYCLAKGKVLPSGKVIVKESIIRKALYSMGARRGDNVWGWI